MNYEADIAEILKDYRSGEIEQITSDDVAKWADQFPYDRRGDRFFLLSEMLHLLNKYYYSRQRATQDIQRFIVRLSEYCALRGSSIQKLNFYKRKQAYGNSRLEMLEMLNAELKKFSGFGINECGGSNTLVYIDDCLFTGVRLKKEVEAILDLNLSVREIIIWYPVVHTEGYYKQKQSLLNLKRKQSSPNFYFFDPMVAIENCNENYLPIEWFWPKKHEDKSINEYLQARYGNANTDEMFRPQGTPKIERVFKSPQGRDVIEKMFFKIGIKLMGDFCMHEHIRPLGFNYSNNLGFGSLFISHRNIANNCPLALWFEPNKPELKWFPLLRRKHNFEGKSWS